jgi:DNA polymerase III subunit delta'
MTFLAHSHTFRELELFIQNPAHALEIQGAEGSGKSFIAQSLAAELLLLKSDHTVKNHPYVHMINVRQDKAGIDDVRELQKKLMLSVPGKQKVRRVVIIEHFDDLGHEAQNAILKTLEEPPLETILILTVSRPDKVLGTIHSRTNQLTVRSVPLQPAIEALSGKYTEDKISSAYRISGGDAGLLYALLEDANHPLKKAIEAAKQLLIGSRYDRLSKIDTLAKDKEITIMQLLDALYRIMDASKQLVIQKSEKSKTKLSYERLKLLQSAIRDLDEGVSAKLVLTRLFFQL